MGGSKGIGLPSRALVFLSSCLIFLTVIAMAVFGIYQGITTPIETLFLLFIWFAIGFYALAITRWKQPLET